MMILRFELEIYTIWPDNLGVGDIVLNEYL